MFFGGGFPFGGGGGGFDQGNILKHFTVVLLIAIIIQKIIKRLNVNYRGLYGCSWSWSRRQRAKACR